MKAKKTLIGIPLLLALAVSLSGQSFPSPQGFVSDFANVLTQETELRITGISNAIEEDFVGT